MAEYGHGQSEQTRRRIGISLRRVWREKLKWRRLRAKFVSLWAESIAKAAKRGGSDQRELDWNSYDKMKEEIAIQQRKWAEAKEMIKLKAAQRKAEKDMRLAQKRKEQEQGARVREEMKRKTRRKSEEEREQLAVANGLNLKGRLTKIHKRKILKDGQISGEDQRTWEKLDLEILKSEHRWREISLADQIQAAKEKRVELVGVISPKSSSLQRPSDRSAE